MMVLPMRTCTSLRSVRFPTVTTVQYFRSLIQVKIEDEAKTKGIFEDLMGENVQPRKEFIVENASSAVNLDI